MDEAFDPDDVSWSRVSPGLARLRRTVLLAAVAGFILVTVVIGLSVDAPTIAIGGAVVGLAVGCWGWWLVGRNYRAWGYAERAEDLLVRHGVAFRQLVVVPYGRMQFVDVTAGPLQRRFGVATVQLHTAAAATDAQIPGLVPAEAARLRDRLAAHGESRAAGL
jgi:hypothetical protein